MYADCAQATRNVGHMHSAHMQGACRARAGRVRGACGVRAGLQQEAELVRLDVEAPVVGVWRHHGHRFLREDGGELTVSRG